MPSTMHITSGDIAGEVLGSTGLSGEILVWHDLLYDGPRTSGWPAAAILRIRSQFIEQMTGGGLQAEEVLQTFKYQYNRIGSLPEDTHVVLWFDACLFDQSMLVHILSCLDVKEKKKNVELLCIDAFEGIEPFIGLGQLDSTQLASCWERRQPVLAEQFGYALLVDRAFGEQDLDLASELSKQRNAPLKWVPPVMERWLQEQPDAATGLGRLESMALEAIRGGCRKPWDIFNQVAAAESPPQFWGDTTLWLKINALADRRPSLVSIEGPRKRLPQWGSDIDLQEFAVRPC